jgi:dethiobiotin synthetase
MYKKYFVSGIGTDVGKTVASAILCKALDAAYWKPVQSGTILGSDKDTIRNLCGDDQVIFEERYALKEPLSPHTAARIEGLNIDVDKLEVPEYSGNLIVEGAGGLMVPITREVLYNEWIKNQNLPVILVSRHYLGSLNHTLLSLALLKSLEIEITGVLFIGKDNDQNESLICERYEVRNLGNIPETSVVNATFVQIYADELVNNWRKSNFTDLIQE